MCEEHSRVAEASCMQKEVRSEDGANGERPLLTCYRKLSHITIPAIFKIILTGKYQHIYFVDKKKNESSDKVTCQRKHRW